MRIISGSARGRQIEAPKGRDTRPTLDRVKEALFGMIQFDLPGARVLDLFSGSGNLGLEALSMGAAFAVFNDAAAESNRVIRANVERLGFEGQALVLMRDYAACLDMLAGRGERFDFVFLDPPYDTGLDGAAVQGILDRGLLSGDGRIIVEHSAARPLDFPGKIGNSRKYGQTRITFLTRPDEESVEEPQI